MPARAVAEASRRPAAARAARELHRGGKPGKALPVGGRAVPAGFGVATVTPAGPGWDSGAVCFTVNGGWFAQSAEILA
jgi:hypothetical protein